ncbi:TPA: hypothetical protein KE814_001693 [Citrobacter freundii]|nr:hypothetical protein [Citrobacter freundii]HEM8819714.1 hypothetical protein [Raoultella planticola]
MLKNNNLAKNSFLQPEWLTIQEAVKIINKVLKIKIKECDIYRHALYGNVLLSIYFQSPFILRKIKYSCNKLKLRPVNASLIERLCILERSCFINDINFTLSTDGEYIIPTQRVINTCLLGHEFVLVQRLLADSLNLPLPVIGANNINYGITVNLSGESFQVFEKITWQGRIKHQTMRLPEIVATDVCAHVSSKNMEDYRNKDCFPIYELPQDACFVIRYAELEKLINSSDKGKSPSLPPSRISTPLSRLLWLACKHNETISPLIRQPYKLLSIFEQWALADGITDRLSGDTLKTALERGSPTSI